MKITSIVGTFSRFLVAVVTFPVWFCRFRNIYSRSEQNPHITSDEVAPVIRDPKGTLYEYRYDGEHPSGHSQTLELIVRTECMELISHPWVEQLLDYKWKSFAKSRFFKDFMIYSAYFVSYFISTYLRVGDPMVGMPFGGYRKTIFDSSATLFDYMRDIANFINMMINSFYTYSEFKEIRDRGSLRLYMRDGWNVFDILQISSVWLLFLCDVLRYTGFESEAGLDKEYTYEVIPTSINSETLWRKYNFEMTIMSIVGPQMFIKFIRFARGNEVFGPFVRMIFKMARDIMLFLVVFTLFLFGFAYTFFTLQLEGFRTFLDATTSVFQISLGDWDWDAILEGGPIAIILFIIYSIIGPIMLLNLLIAMMGRTYDDVRESQFLFYQLERAKVILNCQNNLDDTEYGKQYWCRSLYVLENDEPIEGIDLVDFEHLKVTKNDESGLVDIENDTLITARNSIFPVPSENEHKKQP